MWSVGNNQGGIKGRPITSSDVSRNWRGGGAQAGVSGALHVTSHHGTLGGGEVDGADSHGQILLQLLQDVRVDAGAGGGAFWGRGLIQQLLEAVEFNEQHHVLQEVALYEARQLRGTQELHHTKASR